MLRDQVNVPASEGRWADIADVRLVDLQDRGPIHVSEAGRAAIDEFLGEGEPAAAHLPSGTAVILFADIAGSTSRFVESHYQDRVVVPWTSGAAGDQNPIYRLESGGAERIRPLEMLGRILGEETMRVAETVRTTDAVRLRGAQTVVTCPGKQNPPGARYRPDGNYQFLDADPVDIRLSLLMINQIAITGVSGEVLTLIGQRLTEESPFRETLMITHCNGASGYLPNDAAYDQVSYEIVTSNVKRGCAEDAIVNGLLDLMARF